MMNKGFRKIWLVLVTGTLLLAACAAQASATQAPSMPMAAAPMQESKGIAADSAAGAMPQEAPRTAAEAATVDRVVIKNANLSIVVADPGAEMTKIAGMATAQGGFVVTSQLYKTTTRRGEEVPQASISIRIPADKLDATLEQIKALVKDAKTDVLSENVSGQDVTSQYTDLQSKLRNLEATEKQLQRIMEEAQKTEDVLAVYNQLTQVREQIEVIKGQIKYYDESSSYSLVAVELVAAEKVKPVSIGGWTPGGTARDALQALIDVLQFLGNALIYLVILCLPVVILVGVPLYFIIRGYLRWRARRKAAKAAAAEVTK